MAHEWPRHGIRTAPNTARGLERPAPGRHWAHRRRFSGPCGGARTDPACRHTADRRHGRPRHRGHGDPRRGHGSAAGRAVPHDAAPARRGSAGRDRRRPADGRRGPVNAPGALAAPALSPGPRRRRRCRTRAARRTRATGGWVVGTRRRTAHPVPCQFHGLCPGPQRGCGRLRGGLGRPGQRLQERASGTGPAGNPLACPGFEATAVPQWSTHPHDRTDCAMSYGVGIAPAYEAWLNATCG